MERESELYSFLSLDYLSLYYLPPYSGGYIASLVKHMCMHPIGRLSKILNHNIIIQVFHQDPIPERNTNHHYTYHVAQANQAKHGSLVGRGAMVDLLDQM